MASTNTATPAPLGRRRNPYELLKDEDRRRRSLATANHRERIRALAWGMMPAARATPDDAQATFRAIKNGGCRVLELACLLAAEVTAHDYPHDLPFHPDDQELGDAISRNFRALLQIIKDQIRTGALPVRQDVGVQLGCNADPAVLAWCNDPAAISPPKMLCTTLDNARALAQAIGLNPLRELAGESAASTYQSPTAPEHGQPAERAAPEPPPREPAGTPPDIEEDEQPTTTAPHCAPIARKPDRRQEGERRFIELRKQGASEREALKEVQERFWDKGLSRTSLQRVWKDASRHRAPSALEQLSEASAQNET